MFQYSPILGRFSVWDLKYTFFLFKKVNFRQNMAIRMQPMRTHNLTQTQDSGSYTHNQSNHEYCLLANRPRQGSLVHLHEPQAQFCNVRLCFALSEFFNNRKPGSSVSTTLSALSSLHFSWNLELLKFLSSLSQFFDG